MEIEQTQQYTKFFQEIHDRIRHAQQAALKTVNKELMSLYWDIGKNIVEKQQKENIFDFLELGDEYSERQLENALMARVEEFLQEMGSSLAFIGRQFRLEVSDREYFIDVLLYHRYLKCLVVIELKIGEFMPEYVGKMQFYLAALDSQEKITGENPSIGIILCKTKNRTIVEYALRESQKPIGVAAYTVVKNLPKELKDQLPTAEQIEKLLIEIE